MASAGAIVIGPNSTVTWNGTSISNFVTNVSIEDSADEVEVTGLAETYRTFIPGLKDATLSLTALQSYGSNEIDALLGAAYLNGTAGTIKINPDTNGTVVYTLVGKVYSYQPVNAGVGEASTIDISLRNYGTSGLTRGTA